MENNIKLVDFDIKNFEMNKNYSISASAGTGKTYSMVEIVKKLLENKIKEDKILIVTYTEKAAGELKTRIKEEIPSFDLDSAHIGTIHSFCKDTISEFYLTMGLPAGLNVVDDSKIQFLYDKLVREYLYTNRIELNKIGNNEDKEDLKAIVKKLYLDKNGCMDSSIISFNPKPKILIHLEGLSSLIGKSEQEVIDYFLKFNDPDDGKLTKQIINLFENFAKTSPEYVENARKLGELKTKKDKEPYQAYIDQVDELWLSLYKNITERGVFDYNFSKKKIKTLSDTAAIIKKYKLDEIKAFEQISIDLYKKWQEEKRRNKWFSFNDMLREVREAVICNDSKLVPKLRNKYRYALIDEFQDTNQLQWDVFKKVFLESDSNNIIVVGDRKQSIYSFQGADLTVYDSAVKAIELKGGNLRNLPNNYRSSKAMIDSYNNLFKMGNFSSLDYTIPVGIGLKNLDAKYEDNSIKGINIVVKKENDVVVPVTPFEYASVIVDMISDYCTIENGKSRLLIYDKKGEPHNVTFKDFMILARTRSEFYAIEYELKAAGIPYVKYKDTKLFGGYECKQWIAVINAILKPDFTGKNRNAFRKALYTKFFGKTLLEISSPVYDTDSTVEMDLMFKWKSLASEFKYIELINSILDDSEIEKKMTSLKDIQSLNVFKQIGDYALSYLLAGNSLLELKNNLTRLSEGESDEEEGDSIVQKGTDFDCVELMTMHASKGLDRAIVFVVGGEKQKNNKVSPVGIYHKEELLASGNKTTKAYLTMNKDNYKKEIDKEFDRLFYVAYTRARYLLVLPYYKDNKDVLVAQATKQFIDFDTNKEYYKEVVYEKGKINLKAINNNVKDIIKKNSTIKPETEKDKNDQFNVLKDIYDNMNKHRLFKHSYASMSKIKEDKDVLDTMLNSNKEGNELEEVLSGFDTSCKPVKMNYSSIEPNSIPNKFPKGASVGTTLHEVFENFEFTEIDNDNNNLLNIINDRFKANNLKQAPDFDEYVLNMVSDVLNADLPLIKGNTVDTINTFKLKEIKNYDRKAEAEFNFGLEDTNLSNFCNGFIDLLFKRGDYYSILDWKSDTINDNDLLSYNNLDDIKKRVDGHYSIQRVLYAYTLVHWLYSCHLEASLEEVFNKHFGGIYYVFIRGCKKDTPNGIYAQTWESYSDLEKEFNNIMKIVKRGGVKGGKSDEQ